MDNLIQKIIEQDLHHNLVINKLICIEDQTVY